MLDLLTENQPCELMASNFNPYIQIKIGIIEKPKNVPGKYKISYF